MLVLSRKEGERLVIGDNITIVVSKINGNRVSIGIEAPREVRIVREELQAELDAKEAGAARPTGIPANFSATIPMNRRVG